MTTMRTRSTSFVVVAFLALNASLSHGERTAQIHRGNVSADDASAAQCGGLYPGDATKSAVQFDLVSSSIKCWTCESIPGCKWCPLTQNCMSDGYFRGGSCPVRVDHEKEDKATQEESDCATSVQPPWIQTMKEAYGESSLIDGRHADAVQCIQWALDWPIDGLKSDASNDQIENAGNWACFSALLREGMLASLDGKTVEKPSNLQANSGDFRDGSVTFRPAICSIVDVKYKGCYVRGFKLQEFAQLQALKSRRHQEEFPGARDLRSKLKASIESGPLVSFNPGAGKSGSGFARMWDSQFRVKLGLKYSSVSMNEPVNLVRLIDGQPNIEGAIPLVQHLNEHPDSLLNVIHGMLKLKLGSMNSYVLIMEDAFYGVDAAAEKASTQAIGYGSECAGTEFTRYDLKGESRNQNKENKEGFCLVNGDFKTREENWMKLNDGQCGAFRSAFVADSSFLSKHHMIDYSLALVSVRKREKCSLSCYGTPGSPFCLGGPRGPEWAPEGRHIYTASIIDYLNNFNKMKTAESIASGGKFSGYAKKMNAYVSMICPSKHAKRLKQKVRGRMIQQSGSVDAAARRLRAAYGNAISKVEVKALLIPLFGGDQVPKKDLLRASAHRKAMEKMEESDQLEINSLMEELEFDERDQMDIDVFMDAVSTWNFDEAYDEA